MGSNVDDFEDLDDLLEDPSKLDEETPEEPAKKSLHDKGNKDHQDAEANQMMQELEQEFSKLMKATPEGEDNEAVESFKELLSALGKTGIVGAGEIRDDALTEMQNARSKNRDSGDTPAGFKDIVSNTLDRLKENSTKVDSNLEEEKRKRDTGDILSQLMDQFVDGAGPEGEEGMENAILEMLNQMSSKEVLYEPMREMRIEFAAWMAREKDKEEHRPKIGTYEKQYALVCRIVDTYERPDYTNEAFREELALLLDELEKLGDSPIKKGFNNTEGEDAPDLSGLLNMDTEGGMATMDKEMQEACQQQ
ncbi:LAMI_0A02454g1_1 [Lachancea mirantina]|uniref:LAMI_0A02454g1_1 n=1 Tax=Lachancea mirantina TaxID=1230905 RepID=A0A1G4IMJ8_9SACH|nr:LAMI_0A02454g1_1 [Lachancea mirantina]